jgi:cytochrome c5
MLLSALYFTCRFFARRGGRGKEDSLAAKALKAAAAQADLDSDPAAAAAAAGGSFKDVQGSHGNGSLNDIGVCATDGGTPSAFVRAAAAPMTNMTNDDATSAKQGAAAGVPVASVEPWAGRPDTMVSNLIYGSFITTCRHTCHNTQSGMTHIMYCNGVLCRR